MSKKIIAGLIFFNLSCAVLLAADVDNFISSLEKKIPPIIEAGMDDYAIQGAEGALKTWTKGGPLEGDAKVLGSAQVFHEIEKYYGQYRSYHLISQKGLTPSSKLLYIQMNYDKGPLFLRFLCYLSGDRWVVAGRLLLNTDPDQVLQPVLS